jgi:hydroxymethylpyrimidine pyrophosphatase-like HAD family hydrolase
MLKLVKYAFAMGNAADSIKAIAATRPTITTITAR